MCYDNSRKESLRRPMGWSVVVLLLMLGVFCATSAVAQTRTYTIDVDFDDGIMINVNHDSPAHDQLQLNQTATPFPFINVAASGRGTVVRIDVNTGAILGEYWTSPTGRGRNPSRTTVDLYGNVWVANRNESSGGKGSVTRIGLIIGGTRVNADGTPNPTGQYLAPPFDYSTCTDRDGDGLLKTSRGLSNILPWTNAGGADNNGGVSTAEDECIINYTRVIGTGTRTVAIDANNDVWVGGTGNRQHEKLSGVTGNPIPATQIYPSCGGYGGFIDGYGVLWSARNLLRYDPATNSQLCISLSNSYGLAADNDGNVWNSRWTNHTVTKLAPNGAILATYPTGGYNSRGVAVTAVDNNIWIANSGSNTVTRLNTSGTLLATIPVGSQPTGVAVDANGKVWVTNYSSHTAMRIDPTGGSGLGAVDMTVNLGSGAYPYNYSDMTGAVILTNRNGSWTAVYNGERLGVEWQDITWTSDEPQDTDLEVEARAADVVTDLPSLTFVTVGNGVPLSGIVGQYIEVRVVFGRDQGVEESPVLFDLTIRGVQDVFVDIKPQSCPNPLKLKAGDLDGFDGRSGNTMAAGDGAGDPAIDEGERASKAVIPVAILGTADFDVNEVDGATVMLEGVSPLRWNREDVSTPMGDDAEHCECNDYGPDGFEDLTLKFLKSAVVAAIGSVSDGDIISLTLTGQLLDGGSIEGADCMIIRAGGHALAGDVDPDLGTDPALNSNFPNPFNPKTTISFRLSEAAHVTIEIYNLMGQKVATVADGLYTSGHHSCVWDGSEIASGVYFYRMQTPGFAETRKMILMK